MKQNILAANREDIIYRLNAVSFEIKIDIQVFSKSKTCARSLITYGLETRPSIFLISSGKKYDTDTISLHSTTAALTLVTSYKYNMCEGTNYI